MQIKYLAFFNKSTNIPGEKLGGAVIYLRNRYRKRLQKMALSSAIKFRNNIFEYYLSSPIYSKYARRVI